MDIETILWYGSPWIGILAAMWAARWDWYNNSIRAKIYAVILFGGVVVANLTDTALVMTVVNSFLLALELALYMMTRVRKLVRERHVFDTRLKKRLAEVYLRESGRVVDAIDEQPVEQYDGVIRHYKSDGKKYFWVIELDDRENIYHRIHDKTDEKLEAGGIDIPSRSLDWISDIGLLVHVFDRYHCKVSKADYDAFTGTPIPVWLDVYPYSHANIVNPDFVTVKE